MLVLGTSLIVMLFYLLELANSFPSHFIEPSIALNDFIKHYELAFYNAKDVANQHKRIRRATTSAKANSNQPLKLTIETSNKVFKLVLRPDEYLFADDVVFEGENGKVVNFDSSKVYIGTLEDDERTKVRGIITKDGLFDGTISTQFEEFYVEPISRYKENWSHDTGHTIVYKTSDVNHPDTPFRSCSSNSHTKRKPSDPNTIARRSKRNAQDQMPSNTWPKFDNLLKRVAAASSPDPAPSKNASSYQAFRPIPLFYDFPSANYGPTEVAAAEAEADAVHHYHHHHHHSHHRQNTSPKNSDNMFYDLDLTVPKPLPAPLPPPPSPSPLPPRNPDDQNFNYDYNDTIVRLSNSRANWRPKTGGGLIDTVYKYTANVSKSSKGYQPSSASVIPHKNNPKILVGSGNGGGPGAEESRANLIITSDDSSETHARKRAIVDPKKTTCMLYLQADHLFFEKYGTEETCIEVMTRHVQRVNSIYRNTDFNLDGKADNISFMIKRIKVHSAKDPTYRFPGNYGVEKFLEIFSEEDYDAFCLAYMFTYRDFEMGTLGLAWTGDLKNAGGVCEKNGHYRGSLKSLNTGIVTVLNYGKHVPSAVSHVTLAHEIGHNFGSPHDPDGCTPGGDDGNFIMFARATSGDKKNNNKFSPCSLNAINPVLNVKARSPKGCFTEPQKSICGNGVVEADEECDCGWEEDCKDSCCYPQRRYPPLDEPPCHLTPNAVCSPSQGPCCTTDCKIKSGDICRSDNGCRDSSYCNGISAQCPPSTNKPNKTVCNDEYVCYMGECTGSICLAYGLESCQCIPTAADLPTKACELCCKLPGENQPCLSSFQWNQAPYDVPDMFAKPGTPCNDYNGYCDVFRKCREVDPSGPIATLRKLLLSEENIASFKKWAYDHWYYCGLIFLTFLLFMIISTKLLGKKSKVKTITVLHSSPTETVRLPDGDGAGGNPAVVVHPTAVRTKLPLKKKVREKRRAANTGVAGAGGADENVPHNVNNNNSPIEAKKKKRDADFKSNAKAKTKSRLRKITKKGSQAAGVSGAPAASHVKVNAASTEDPLGKVRNWLINSHNMDNLGSLKKSKSSPASFDLSDANSVKKRQKVQSAAVATAATGAATVAVKPTPVNVTKTTETGKTAPKKSKDTRVKLQVVYKPPFKFSLKLGKQKNEISSHLIKDKRPEAVKQRAALLIRADRIRANAVTTNAAATPSASANNEKSKSKSKNVSCVTAAENNDNNVLDGGDELTGADSGAKPSRPVEYKRSVSAPQSTEPVYENTICENGTSAATNAGVTSSSLQEPHYANFGGVEQKNECDTARTKHRPNGTSGVTTESIRNSSSIAHPSSSTIKRSCSNDFRSSVSKPSSNANSRTFTKRRNSYDTKHAIAGDGEPVVEYVKRQHSNESDVLGAAARNESRRKSAVSIRRTSSGDVKPGANLSRSHQPRKSTSYRKSYHDRTSSGVPPFADTSKSDVRNKKSIQQQQPPSHQAEYNLISFGSPSFDRTPPVAAVPKRKTSYDAPTSLHDSALNDSVPKNGSNKGHVTRAASHSTRRKTEGDKFKRFSLQNATETSTVLPTAVAKGNFSNVSPSLNTTDTRFNTVSVPPMALNATQYAENPFHQQQYDVPSDLEVLLSETENPIDI